MKVTKGGDYIKTDSAEKGLVVTFLDAGRIDISDKYRYKNADGTDGEFRKSLVFEVLYKGEKKQIRVNTASKIAMIDAFGEETQGWIGKKATIHVLPTPNGQQKMIVLDPVIEGTKQVKDPSDIAPDWND